jgi:nitrite reductase/ring-hydroxylating ferredoxin subunit
MMTEPAKLRRVPLCGTADLADGTALRVPSEHTGTRDAVAVFRDGEAYYALEDTCPHAKASLAEGWVEHGEVECPQHGARFDLRTGEALSLPAAAPAAVCPIEVRDGRVWLLIPEQASG